MSITDLPTPEDLGTRLLVFFFGPGATIVVVYGLVMAALAWKSAAETSMKVGRFSRNVAGQAVSLPPVAFGFAFVTSVVLLAVQVMWIWTCFVAGNAWSYIVNPPGEIPEGGPEWSRIFGSLHWDVISQVYLGACLVALLACYVAAARGSDSTAIAFLLIAPTGLAALIAAFPAALVLIYSVMRRLSDGVFVFDPFAKGILLLLGLALTHIVTCLMALSTPDMMKKVWTRR